jgi:hypothetical protein
MVKMEKKAEEAIQKLTKSVKNQIAQYRSCPFTLTEPSGIKTCYFRIMIPCGYQARSIKEVITTINEKNEIIYRARCKYENR